MTRDELKDRAISLLKDTYAIGYKDGVKATNVDCGVVWEERIDAIKEDIENIYCGQYCEHIYTADEVRELALEIINKHCGGDNE